MAAHTGGAPGSTRGSGPGCPPVGGGAGLRRQGRTSTIPSRMGSTSFRPYVVGWQASRSLRSDLAIDALEMATFNRQRAGADLSGLVHHSDRGVQGGFRWSSQHLEMEVEYGTAAGLAGDADGTAGNEVAWASSRSSGCGAGVLGEDRRGSLQRGRCSGVRGVRAGRDSVVPRAWRVYELDAAGGVPEEGSGVCSCWLCRSNRRRDPRWFTTLRRPMALSWPAPWLGWMTMTSSTPMTGLRGWWCGCCAAGRRGRVRAVGRSRRR